MRFCGEGEGWRRAPFFLFAIAVLVFAYGNGVLREIGEGLHDLAQTLVGGHGYGFERLDFGFEDAGLFGLGGGVGSGLAELCDLFGELVALGLEGFKLGDGFTAFAVDCGEVAEGDGGVHAAGTQLFFYQGQVCPNKC